MSEKSPLRKLLDVLLGKARRLVNTEVRYPRVVATRGADGLRIRVTKTGISRIRAAAETRDSRRGRPIRRRRAPSVISRK